MENDLKIYEEKFSDLEKSTRFYLNTPDKVAAALVFCKKLENFAEEIREKVRERALTIMNDENINEIEFGNWKVTRVEPSESVEYSAGNVIDAIGIDIARQFLKVSGSKLEWWMKKSKLEGEILSKINEGKKIKHRKGYIRLSEKTNESN